MTDLKLQLTDQGLDLLIKDGDAVLDEGLVTPVMVSLYSDARQDAPGDPASDPEDDPRGAWFDLLSDRFGSELWRRMRDKATPQNAEKYRKAVEDCLQWLIRDGIAEFVDARATVGADSRVDVRAKVTRGSATQHPGLWEGISSQTLECAPGVTVQILPML